jgi:hypothetical protein
VNRFAAPLSIWLAVVLGPGAAYAEPSAGLARAADVDARAAPAPCPSGCSPPEPARSGRLSPGLMVAGILTTTLGSGGVGLAVYLADDNGQYPDPTAAAVVTLLAGLSMIGAGIPMIVVGARKVPATSEEASLAAPHIMVGPFGVSGTF